MPFHHAHAALQILDGCLSWKVLMQLMQLMQLMLL
jgi:hypothetical protein